MKTSKSNVSAKTAATSKFKDASLFDENDTILRDEIGDVITWYAYIAGLMCENDLKKMCMDEITDRAIDMGLSADSVENLRGKMGFSMSVPIDVLIHEIPLRLITFYNSIWEDFLRRNKPITVDMKGSSPFDQIEIINPKHNKEILA